MITPQGEGEWLQGRKNKKRFWAELDRARTVDFCTFFGMEFAVTPWRNGPIEKGQIGIKFGDKGESHIREIILQGRGFISSLREGFGLRFPKDADLCRIVFPPSLTGLKGDRQIYLKSSGLPGAWQKQSLPQDQILNLASAIREIETNLFPPSST